MYRFAPRLGLHMSCLVFTYAPLLAAATERRGEARLERCGLPPPVATSWACAIFPTQCVFTHTQNPPPNIMQAAAGSLTRSTLAACRHEPLSESARRSPWLPPTAPVPLPRFACFVSGSIEAIRHASISRRGSLCSPMRRACWHGCANAIRPAASAHFWCRLHRADGALHVAAWSLCSPTRHVCRHGYANGVSRAASARFSCGAGFGRRRPLPASAAVRAVRLLPSANAFRPAHRLHVTLAPCS